MTPRKSLKWKYTSNFRGQIELSPLLEVQVDIVDNTECTFFALQLYLMCILYYSYLDTQKLPQILSNAQTHAQARTCSVSLAAIMQQSTVTPGQKQPQNENNGARSPCLGTCHLTLDNLSLFVFFN